VIKITEEEFNEWKTLPVTKRVLQFFGEEAGAHREIVSKGGCIPQDWDATKAGQEYLRRMIIASFYDNLIYNLEYSDIYPEEESNDDNEDTSSRA